MGRKIKNIGRFTEKVDVIYVTGETETDLGAAIKTVETKTIYANAEELDDIAMIQFGMNLMDKAVTFTMRNEIDGRVEHISWNDDEYYPVRVKGDKKSRFLIITARAK
jgi:hypothetical protein